ncbi:MAG TPA: dTDP-4-dehydrorhamnose reductase [Thermomicrobiales bacterium]|nr:dTDP-4-dehydrorhamnose reductase [Thermomicrobiales bacterium]
MASGERVLVTGAAGQLGTYLLHRLNERGYIGTGLGRSEAPGVDVVADIRDNAQLAAAIDQVRPNAIIHAAAYTDVDGCERDPDLADAINRVGSTNVAELARERGIWVIGIGTDFVFSGSSGAPYFEDASPDPISVYGKSKLAGERAVLSADAGFAVARTAWVYGGRGKHFPRTVLTMLERHGRMEVVDDEVGSPTFAGDLAEALVALLPQRPAGILHLTNEGSVSRFDLAQRVAMEAGRDPSAITPVSTQAFLEKYPLPARRPANSTLRNSRAANLGVRLPPWDEAVRRYVPNLATEIFVPAPTDAGSR